jgi:glycosyl transferase family 2
MPRIGMNPSRGRSSDYKPARVTLAMITYLPEQAGYFQNRFDVTRLSLESLIAHTLEPHDLFVFDNGSCDKLVDYLRGLRDAGRIHYLILSSRNIGKIGALQVIFNAAPGEIIAYTDDDVFFLPGWLDEHLKIIDTFPNVGSVTGFYMRPLMTYGIQSTLKFCEQPDVKTERGQLIPRDMEQRYIDNMGRTWESYQEESKGLEDLVLTYNGVQAFASAGHHQFVAPRKVVLEALPKGWSGQLMGKMRDLDNEVDRLGYLRLCTRSFPTRLLGNAISEENAAMAKQYGIEAKAVNVHQTDGALARLYRLGPVQSFARRIYNWMFDIVNAK